jgi:hypothetical protein
MTNDEILKMDDLRFAVRQLLKNPGCTVAAVLTPAPYLTRKPSRDASFKAFGSKLQNVSQAKTNAEAT